jgi:small-conductance mechanosensitive channel
VRNELQEFLLSLDLPDAVDAPAAADRELADLRGRLDVMADVGSGGENLSQLGFNDLVDLQTQIRADLRNLTARANQATTRASRRDEQLDELHRRGAEWRRLTESARQRNAPASVLDVAATTQSEIDAARRQLEEDRNRSLELLGTIAGMQHLAMTLDQELRQRREDLEAGSQMAAEAPLWDAEVWSASSGIGEAAAAWRRHGNAVVSYVRNNAASVLGVFVLIWLSAHWLLRATGNRVRDGMQKDSASLRGAAVFQRPSSAALVAAIVGLVWFGPPAPSAFGYLLGAILPIPAAALAITVFARPIQLSIWTIAVVLSTMALEPFIESTPLLGRILLILQTGATALAVWTDYRRGRFAQAFPIVRPAMIRWLVSAVCIALSLSILLEIVGQVGIANTLRTTILGGLGLAMIFAAIGFVLIALALALVHIRPFSALPVVRNRRWTIVQTVRRWIRYLVIALWVLSTLKYAGLLTPVSDKLEGVFEAEVRIGEITIDMSSIVAGAGILFATWLVSSIVRFVLAGKSMSGAHVAADLTFAISKLLRYAIAVLGFVFALAVMGFDLTKVTVLAGALGLGIGFGLQNIVQNFISGLILLFERPIKINDITEVDKFMGTVKEMNIRSTVIETADGAEVIVPNADLVTKTVTNWTKSNRRRRAEIDVNVAYGSDPQAVLDILERIAKSHEDVLSDPESFAAFVGFGEGWLSFRLYFWLTDLTEVLRTPTRIRQEILEALEAAGIDIPYPLRDVRITMLAGAQVPDAVLPGPAGSVPQAT